MNRFIRTLCLIVSFNLIFVSLSGFSSSSESSVAVKEIRDEKIFCNATIDQNFDDNSVIVIMDNISGGINKQHELSYFGDIGATAIIDLTSLSVRDSRC